MSLGTSWQTSIGRGKSRGSPTEYDLHDAVDEPPIVAVRRLREVGRRDVFDDAEIGGDAEELADGVEHGWMGSLLVSAMGVGG